VSEEYCENKDKNNAPGAVYRSTSHAEQGDGQQNVKCPALRKSHRSVVSVERARSVFAIALYLDLAIGICIGTVVTAQSFAFIRRALAPGIGALDLLFSSHECVSPYLVKIGARSISLKDLTRSNMGAS